MHFIFNECESGKIDSSENIDFNTTVIRNADVAKLVDLPLPAGRRTSKTSATGSSNSIDFNTVIIGNADVAKLVDALDLGSSASRRGGSSPSIRTHK